MTDHGNITSNSPCKINGKKADKKFFLFFPLEADGHINPALSMGNELRRRGHETALLCINDIGYPDQRVICLKKIKKEREKKVASEKMKKLEETDEKIAEPTTEIVSEVGKRLIKQLDKFCLGSDPVRVLNDMFEAFSCAFKETNSSEWNDMIRETIIDLKPDVIIVDHGVIPAVMNPSYNQKWVRICSTNPLELYSSRRPDIFPAPNLGAPVVKNTDDERQLSWKHFSDAIALIKPLLESSIEKAQLEIKSPYLIQPESPHLNIYIYPRELDYHKELGSNLKNWHRIQSMNRPKFVSPIDETTSKFDLLSRLEIPQDLRHFIRESMEAKNKLLFMSLGTIACMDIRMMKRLVSLLEKTPYKIIVSKGARHHEFDLAPNMWGDKYVPQKEILLLVDLVITHGGNNTITECLYSGVPGIIVCPMFGDQFDNATRIEEKKMGLRVDLGNAESDKLLLESIENVLADEEMKTRIKKVSLEMRQLSEGPEKAADLIESLALA